MTEEEWQKIKDDMGITPDWELQNAKDTAMNRHNVKKSRRKHLELVLDEFIGLIKKENNI